MLKKSKSADNLNQLKCASNQSIGGSSIKSTNSHTKKNSFTNLSVANKRTHKSMDELHRNFNEINYLKLFELLFTNNKQYSMKQENKNNFFKNFFNFLGKNTELVTNKTTANNSNDLESKLEQMKVEIEQLKTTLNNTVQDSKALSFLANDSKSPAKMQTQQQKKFQIIRNTRR
jgi:hypothetical protein